MEETVVMRYPNWTFNYSSASCPESSWLDKMTIEEPHEPFKNIFGCEQGMGEPHDKWIANVWGRLCHTSIIQIQNIVLKALATFTLADGVIVMLFQFTQIDEKR